MNRSVTGAVSDLTVPRFVTLGVFGATEADFFKALRQERVTHFVDMRRRRGVRGREYAFVNHARLVARLQELGVRYHHALELAPTQEIRDLQKQEDLLRREGKRARQGLGEAFCRAYVARQLLPETLGRLLVALPDLDGRAVVALFCVEGPAEACHRSLVARYLEQVTGQDVAELVLNSGT